MHIQEGPNTTLTTCTKMTEEVDRRHGVNGNSSKGASEDAPVHSAINSTGGRLKFFKDGKFILELVRACAREGERPGWVSVPRKTFWPPAAAPATPPAGAPPPSASLSVSDDNSSVQSSPWQRDHCWKQTAPRKNISKELAMYYCRPSSLTISVIEAASRAKRRRPYDTSHLEAQLNGAATKRGLLNGVCDKKKNGDSGSPESDVVDGVSRAKSHVDDAWADYDREKYYHMKLKKPYQYRKLRVYKKTRSPLRRKELTRIVTKLHERLPALPAPINVKLANCRQEHAMVSPRKRILRELERVSLEDQTTKRRAKTVPALSTASYPPSPGPSHVTHKTESSSRSYNGVAPRKETPVSKNVSSYSIHSLLSMPDESPARPSPEAKRSPHSYPPSLKTESPSSVNSPDLSPSPDNYRYRYSTLMGSPGQSALARDSPTPPHELARYRQAYAAPPSPYGTRQWPPAGAPIGHTPYRGSPSRDEWPRDMPYVYPYPYVPPHLYRPPAPLWMHYAVPPGPWAPLALPLVADHVPKDEPTSDGKFILELVRACAREGERPGWVSVPRKTFWPPAAAPATPPAGAPPPSASLSVSDDNSSVQSSPWQRDHCWKQTAPRKNISKELAMYYCRPSSLTISVIEAASRAKRRRPYDTSHLEAQLNGAATKRGLLNGVCDKKKNGDSGSPESDVVDGVSRAKSHVDDAWADYDREKYYHMKLKKPYQYRKLRVYKKTRSPLRRKELTRIVTKLHERLPALPAPINVKLANCRQEHAMVSPRKRILRELERVSLEDQTTKRRAKTVPALSTASYPPSPGPSHVTHKTESSSRSYNGVAPRKETPVSKNVSSYSIHSLLSMPDESPARPSPEAKRSPHSYPPSLKTESPSSVNSPDLSPSPDNYRYRYSTLMGSPGQSALARDSPTPPHELARYRQAYAAPPSPYGTRQWPPAGAPIGHTPYRGSPSRDEWPRDMPYVYPYPYVPPHLYRPPAPLWMHYAVPPGPWAPLALPLVADHVPKDEPTSDLPLNLSKH